MNPRQRLAIGVLRALCAFVLLTAQFSSTVPINAQTTHTVTWDKYSLIIDGQRTYIWSGEIHPFRLPSPDLWRDILQKMKSNGFNAVGIYVDWGYHSPKQGVYDFTGVRDMDKFLDIAQEVGIYVIARPGPYINGETDSGGYPGWLQTTPGTARTNNATYMSYTDEYQTAIDAILARHQLTNGTGTVILYQIENEYANNVTSSTGKNYMAHLYQKARDDGITVPIFHNDKGRNGYWVPPGALSTYTFTFPANETPPNYLYGFDGYPAGTCSTSGNPGTPGAPPDWGYFGAGGVTGGSTASPNTPGLMAEFGGGWFDPWGDLLWGGAGYPCMRTRLNAAMERQYYLTNVANGIKINNVYMTFGGTNWGWLAAPVVYTSYDYGAAIDEARNLTTKVPPMKEMGYFLQSVPEINKIDKASTITPTVTGPKVYHLTNPDTGTHFVFVRSDSTSANYAFRLPITTADGAYTIPQSGNVQLVGVDMKALVANYNLDSQHLVYATSEIMTHAANLNGQDVALLYTRNGQSGETVLRYASATEQPTVTTLTGTAPTVTWNSANGDLRLNYTGSGLTAVQITGSGVTTPFLLLLTDESTAQTFWRLDTAAGAVIVRGPWLLRTASVNGSTVALTGDTNNPAPLEVWAPAGVTSVTWNGAAVDTTAQAWGSLLANSQLSGAPTITLPALTGWKYSYGTPEVQVGFDDSTWQIANKTSTNSNTAIPSGQKDLFADDYGFHYGDVWYRGTYSNASAATAISLRYQTGSVGMLEAWLDGTYLGVNQIATPTSGQSTTATWSATPSFSIPTALRNNNTHLLAVLVRPMAHEEDGGANNAFKNARGLLSATFTGSTQTITWKIQGDQGGENIADTVRGVMNNGGLYGERAGWYLPDYPASNWTPVTLPYVDSTPGVAWYRTTFNLGIPDGVDASLGINITDINTTKAYRALIFVNGWNMGQYINNVGPQHTFIIPTGIMNPNGQNTLAVAVITNNNNGGSSTGGGLGTVSLVNLGTVAGGTPVSLVDSPVYQAPTVAGVLISGSEGSLFSGSVATVSVPPDAAGALAATIDWGDGSQTAGTLSGGGNSYTVSGSHTYADDGSYPVTVTISDLYNQSTLATGTTTAQIDNVAPTVTLSGDNTANEGETKHYTFTTNDPGQDTFSVVSESCGANGTLSNAAFDENTGAGSFDCTFLNGPASSGVSVQVADSDGAPSNVSTITVSIGNVAPAVSSDLAWQSVQYTDRIQTVTLAATDVAADLPLSASTQWALDGGAFQSGLPSWLALTPVPCTVDGIWGTCTWTLTSAGPVPVKAGTFVVRITVSDGLDSSYTDVTIVVTPEDAAIQYTGETIAQIGTNLTLRATVWDSAASGYLGANPETGPSATIGDITKIWIAFDLYPVNNCLSGTPTTKYAQVSDTGTAGDGIGTASSTFTSASEAGYCVVARLVAGSGGGANPWYKADNAEAAVLTFYENTGQFATGGGWVNDPNGSKGYFGFNARANKKGQPQGHMVYVYRGLYNGVPADFVIRSTALDALAFIGKSYPIPATLQGKATLQINRSSDGALLYSDGNATFQATVVDSGLNSGIGSDSFALTVYDKNGVVYKSVPTALLQGGNVVIHQ